MSVGSPLRTSARVMKKKTYSNDYALMVVLLYLPLARRLFT